MLSEYDQRQIELMIKLIARFQNDSWDLIALNSLTDSLEGLLYALENVNTIWKEKFREHWWELEFTASCMIDEEMNVPTEEDKQAVLNGLNEINLLIKDVL